MNWHDLSQGACAQERRRCRAFCLAKCPWQLHISCSLSFVAICCRLLSFVVSWPKFMGDTALSRAPWFAIFLRRIVFQPREADRSRSGRGVQSPKPVDGDSAEIFASQMSISSLDTLKEWPFNVG